MKIKVIAYNILNGFRTDRIPYKLEKDRIKYAAKLIENENPDILILCEASFGPLVMRHPLKNIYGLFKKVYDTPFFSPDAFWWAPVILSKYPIEGKNIGQHFKNGIRGIVKIKNKEIVIDGVHPAPHQLTEEERRDWVKEITMGKKSNYIIAGDFNALSPNDSYDKNKLVNSFRGFHKEKTEKIVEGMLSAKTISHLLENGFVDTYKEKNKSWHHTHHTNYYKQKEDLIRIDYIFCTSDWKILDAGIIKNKLAEKASDHYPVYAVLETK